MVNFGKKSLRVGRGSSARHFVQTPERGIMRARGAREYTGYDRPNSVAAVVLNLLIDVFGRR